MPTPPAPAANSTNWNLQNPQNLHQSAAVAGVIQSMGLNGKDPNVVKAVSMSSPVQQVTQAGPPQAPPATTDGTPGKFNYSQNPDDAEKAGYNEKEAAILRTQQAETDSNAKIAVAEQQAAKMANFKNTVYKQQRLQEMKPTEDIDKAILQVRQQALYDSAHMWEEFQTPNGIDPVSALAAIQARQNMYTGQINDLEKFRQARLDDADNKIQDEIDGYNQQADAAKTNVTVLKGALDRAKASGATDAELGQMHVTMAQFNKQLQKARAGTNGMPTDKEMVESEIRSQYTSQDLPPPTGVDMSLAVKRVLNQGGSLLGEIRNAGGDYTRMKPLMYGVGADGKPDYNNPTGNSLDANFPVPQMNDLQRARAQRAGNYLATTPAQ